MDTNVQFVVRRERQRVQQYVEDLGNGVRLEMRKIPGGKFLMGAPEDEEGSADTERPQHEVTVSDFFLGKTPVTQAQWRAEIASKFRMVFLGKNYHLKWYSRRQLDS